MNYVIIGNSAAGIGAVEAIRKHDEQNKIILIGREPYHVYSRPLISYYVAGKVNFEKMKYRPDNFYNKFNVETLLGREVTALDTAGRCVNLDNNKCIKFDKLLIATGGKPFIPPIKGHNKNGIFTFIKFDDVKAIKHEIDNNKSEKAVILGAGLIGLKAAEALTKRGIKVTVIELAEQILNRILDPDAAGLVQTYLENRGINFIMGDTITEFKGSGRVNYVNLKSGQKLLCDLGIIAVGVRPNCSFIDEVDIKIDQGIPVNKKMETNIADIYAAGDVCQGYNMLQGTAGVIPIWPNASSQGLTAGNNMAGVDNEYEEGFARNAIGFFDLPLITAGIIEPEPDREEEYQVFVETSTKDQIYKKIIIRNNKLVGYIFINKIDRAGILTGLIREQKDIDDIKDRIMSDDFGYLTFAKQWREEKLYK